jgi:hypothetical protein
MVVRLNELGIKTTQGGGFGYLGKYNELFMGIDLPNQWLVSMPKLLIKGSNSLSTN